MAVKVKSVCILQTTFQDSCTFYELEVTVDETTWKVHRRFRDFSELDDKLVSHCGLPRGLLPPKIVNNKSKKNIEKRLTALQEYMTCVIARWEQTPRDLLDFVHYEEHDVVGVTGLLTRAVIEKGERMLRSDQMVEFTPQQLHCITRRLTTEAPTCDPSSGRPSADVGHLFDFICQVKKLKIRSLPGDVTSDAVVGTKGGFVFDLSLFKAVEFVALHEVDPALIRGVEGIQPQLKKLAVHFCSDPLQTVLVTGDLWTISNSSGSHMSDIRGKAQPWMNLTYANFRCNEIKRIDPAVKLLVNVVTLDLSQNAIAEIDNLDLPQLRNLDLSQNRITSLVGIELKLGNVSNLNLAHNKLESLDGVGRLYSLILLDVSNNDIHDLLSLGSLGRMPCLEILKLEDNPLAMLKQYRRVILGVMQDGVVKQLTLDGIRVTRKELHDIEKSRALALSVIGPTELPNPALTIVSTRESRLVHLASDDATSDVVVPVQSVDDEDRVTPDNRPDLTRSFQEQVESIRQEGGKHWLSMYNELTISGEGSQEVRHQSPVSRSSQQTPTFHQSPQTMQQKGTGNKSPKLHAKSLAANHIKSKDGNDAISSDLKVTCHTDFTQQVGCHDFTASSQVVEGQTNLFSFGFSSQLEGLICDALQRNRRETCAHLVAAWHPGLSWADLLSVRPQLQSLDTVECILTVDCCQKIILEVGLDTGLTKATYHLKDLQRVTMLEHDCPILVCEFLSSHILPQLHCHCYIFKKTDTAALTFALLYDQASKKGWPAAARRTLASLASENDEDRLAVFFQQNVSQRCCQAGVLLDLKQSLMEVSSVETIVASLDTMCLPYAMSDRELPVTLILTDHCIHLLRRYQTEDRLDYEWIYGLPLTSLCQAVIGLFDQSFRLETANAGQAGTFAILTRDANLTNSFVEKLHSLVQTEGDMSMFISPDENVLDRLRKVLSSGATQQLVTEAPAQHDLILYVLLFELLADESAVARTLIVTTCDVFLCDEDLVHWPLPTFAMKEPATPQFVVLKHREVKDLATLELYNDGKHSLFDMHVLFDDTREDFKETWQLRTSSLSHQQLIVSSLKRHWQDMYNAELAVANHGNAEFGRYSTPGLKAREMTPSALDKLSQLSPEGLADFLRQGLTTAIERVVHFVWASFVVYVSDTEFDGCLILTPTVLYLVTTESDLEPDVNVNVRHLPQQLVALSVLLEDLVQVTVSLFDQYVRIEGNNESQTFSCLMRDSQQTVNFVTTLRKLTHELTVSAGLENTAQKSDVYSQSLIQNSEDAPFTQTVSKVTFSAPTEDMLSSLNSALKESITSQRDSPIIQYTLVHEDVNSGKMVSRTLVLTDEDVFLLTEDYVHFPVPRFCRCPPLVDQFKVVQHWPIRSLKRVEFVDFSEINRLGLVFTNVIQDTGNVLENLQESLVNEGYVKVDIDKEHSRPLQSETLTTVWIVTGSYRERETLLTKLVEQYNAQKLSALPIVKSKQH